MVESMRKQLVANNQGCDFSHMTKILESGSEGWYDGSMKPPRAQAASIFLFNHHSHVIPMHVFQWTTTFGILPLFQEERREKAKGKGHRLDNSTPFGKVFQLLLTSQWPELSYLVDHSEL